MFIHHGSPEHFQTDHTHLPHPNLHTNLNLLGLLQKTDANIVQHFHFW